MRRWRMVLDHDGHDLDVGEGERELFEVGAGDPDETRKRN
jgi:hypothetical protein